jgi:KDO2-lipid IV(A) lauroyltransferase
MHTRRTPPLKLLRYFAEACVIWLMLCVISRLSIDTASAFGSWLGRSIGPRLAVDKTARKNLLRAMPELSNEQCDQIILGMWDNLGRTAAEFPHVFAMSSTEFAERVEIEGAEHLEILKNAPTGGLIFSGHLGNWEIFPRVAMEHGLQLSLIYRHANNPYVDRFITRQRQRQHLKVFAKGKDGAKNIIRALKEKATIAMLIDQKMNDGIAVPFFNIPAMTAPAIAKLALAYNCPIVPATMVRCAGARFKVVILPPITVPPTDDAQQDYYNIMLHINGLLEEWIRKNPQQWFWVHQRWGKI